MKKKNFVTALKSMCPKLQKSKTQNVKVWNKKGLLIKKAPTEKMEDLILKSITITGLGERFLRGYREKCWQGSF